jgi:hypothetical protein
MARKLAKRTAAACFAPGVFKAPSVIIPCSSAVKPSAPLVQTSLVKGFSRKDLICTKLSSSAGLFKLKRRLA